MPPGAFQTLAGHCGHSGVFNGTLSHMVKQDAARLGSAGEPCLVIVTVVEIHPFKTEGQEPLAKSLWCSAPNLPWWTCHSVLGPQFEGLLIHLVFGKPHWVTGQNVACSYLGSGKVHGNKGTFGFSFWASSRRIHLTESNSVLISLRRQQRPFGGKGY